MTSLFYRLTSYRNNLSMDFVLFFYRRLLLFLHWLLLFNAANFSVSFVVSFAVSISRQSSRLKHFRYPAKFIYKENAVFPYIYHWRTRTDRQLKDLKASGNMFSVALSYTSLSLSGVKIDRCSAWLESRKVFWLESQFELINQL